MAVFIKLFFFRCTELRRCKTRSHEDAVALQLVLVSAKQMTTHSLSFASELLDVFIGVKTNLIDVRFVAGQDIISGKFSNSFTAGGYN